MTPLFPTAQTSVADRPAIELMPELVGTPLATSLTDNGRAADNAYGLRRLLDLCADP